MRSALVLVGLVAAAVCLATDFPEQEPNDTFPPGPSLGLFQSGDRITGAINPTLDVDYHYIDTAGTGQPGLYRYRFVVQGLPAEGDSLLTLFDTNNPAVTLQFSDDAAPGVLWSRAVYDMWTDGSPVRWGVLIEGWTADDTWPYAIQVTWAPVTFLQAGEFDAGAITFDTSLSTGIDDTEITLFGAGGAFLATNDDISGANHLSRLTETLPPGEYYLAVSGWNTWTPEPGQDRTGIGPGEQTEGAYTLTINGVAFNGTVQRGYADWYRVVVRGKTVSGHVTLDSYRGDPADEAVAFEVREAGTTNVLETHIVGLASDGAYSFDTAESGTVDVAAKGRVWLRSARPVDLGGLTDAVDFTLIGGDANGDNVVNLVDLNWALLNFGLTGAGLLGEVNGDGIVDVADLNLMFLRFTLSGDP